MQDGVEIRMKYNFMILESIEVYDVVKNFRLFLLVLDLLSAKIVIALGSNVDMEEIVVTFDNIFVKEFILLVPVMQKVSSFGAIFILQGNPVLFGQP